MADTCGFRFPRGASPTWRVAAIAVWLSAMAVATIDGAAAQAARGRAPWCADMRNDIAECDYYSYRQCMARASGVSNFCFTNPNYVPPPVPVAPAPKRRAQPRAN